MRIVNLLYSVDKDSFVHFDYNNGDTQKYIIHTATFHQWVSFEDEFLGVIELDTGFIILLDYRIIQFIKYNRVTDAEGM